MESDDEPIDYEGLYGLWLEALLAKTGYSKGQVAHHLRKKAKALAKSEKELADALGLTDAAVRNWFSRKSIPAESKPILLEALIEFVQECVPEWSENHQLEISFKETILGLKKSHFKNSKTGRKLPKISELLLGSESLLTEVAPTRVMDQRKLSLGSWAFDGAVPPYCERSLDAEIINRLSDENKPFTFIVGVPKSGKTRTLVNALSQSKLVDTPALWISATAGSLDQILKQLAGMSYRNLVFVLDDLQKFRFDNDSGLSFEKLMELSKHGKVLGTIHISNFERWQSSRTDHRQNGDFRSPGPQTLNLLLANSLYLSAQLNDAELLNADSILGGTQAYSQEISYLPAWLASVDALIDQTKLLQVAGPLEQALIASIFDARILYPNGINVNRIQELAKSRYKYKFPNGYWSDSEWEKLLVEVTTGVTPGSPHSVLMRSPDNPDKFVILDAVWDAIGPSEWEINGLDFESLDVDFVAEAALVEGYFKTVIEVLEPLGSLLDSHQFLLLGQANQYLGELGAALKWHRLGAEFGNVQCLNLLAQIYISSGELELAESAIHEFRSSEFGDLEVSLGIISLSKGDIEAAEDHFKIASELGDPVGFHNIALFHYQKGEFDLSTEFAQKAVDAGFEVSKIFLALKCFDDGLFDQAEKLLEAIQWFPFAAILQARIAMARGDLQIAQMYIEEAESLRERFSQSGFYLDQRSLKSQIELRKAELSLFKKEFEKAENMLKPLLKNKDAAFDATRLLGVLHSETKNYSKAIKLFKNYPDNSVMAHDLAVVFLRQNLPEKAKNQFLLAGQLGNSYSYLQLGNLLAEEGLYQQAIEYYSLASVSERLRVDSLLGKGMAQFNVELFADARETFKLLPDLPIAINNLGAIEEREGNKQLAEQLYLKSAELGEHLAAWNLCLIYTDRDELDEAKKFANQVSRSSNPNLIFSAGNWAFNQEDFDLAKVWLENAANLGHPEAANNLGVIYENENDFAKAERWYKVAADAGIVRGMVNLALVLTKKSRLEEALGYLETAQTKGAEDAPWFIAELEIKSKKFESALSRLIDCVSNEFVFALFSLADLYEILEQPVESAKWLQKALAIEQDDVILEVIDFFESQGDFDRAQKWRNRASALRK